MFLLKDIEADGNSSSIMCGDVYISYISFSKEALDLKARALHFKPANTSSLTILIG